MQRFSFKPTLFLVIWTWLISQKIDPDPVIPIWALHPCFICRSFVLFLYLQFKGSSSPNQICSGSCGVSSLIRLRNLLFTMTEAVFALVVCSPSPPPLFLSSILLFVVLDYFLGWRTWSLYSLSFQCKCSMPQCFLLPIYSNGSKLQILFQYHHQ